MHNKPKYLKKYLKNRLINHVPSEASNIFLFALRRGGSTLLAEAIAGEPGVCFFNEPLACFKEHKEYEERITWLPLLPDSQFFDLSSNHQQKLEIYIKNLLMGNLLQLSNSTKPKFFLKTNRVLMKILNAPFLVDWFSNIQPCQIIFLSRHPASQTLSVLRNKWSWSAVTYFSNVEFMSKYFTSYQISFGQSILSEATEWEKGILNWIIETYFPLYLTKSEVFHVTYEELVLNNLKIMSNIRNYLKLNRHLSNICKTFDKPSSSSIMSDNLSIQMLEKGNRNFLINK